MSDTLKTLLKSIQAGRDLSEEESRRAIQQIMEGKLSAGEVKQFLLALRQKGEALSEVVGAARAMREHATPFRTDGRLMVDTCGTGGDGLRTVNISTMAALVAAGAGAAVAKHGNRSVTSFCGSADLLEALGVKIDVEPSVVERCLRETNFGFLFAPRFHPAMKAVAPIRKELAVPTIFNLLGPLTNPAGVKNQVVGVADPQKMDLYARALQALGVERVLVVHGFDGQDELSTTGSTEVIELNGKIDPTRLARYTLQPETFGISKAQPHQIQGGNPAQNAQVALDVLNGQPGPVRDAVLFNAAAALYVAEMAGDLGQGLTLAAHSIDQAQARAVLEKVKQITNE